MSTDTEDNETSCFQKRGETLQKGEATECRRTNQRCAIVVDVQIILQKDPACPAHGKTCKECNGKDHVAKIHKTKGSAMGGPRRSKE